MRDRINFILQVILLLFSTSVFSQEKEKLIVHVYVDSILNDVSNHPIGINVNYFMDGGRFPNARRSVADALKAMGVKYLRYPGGDKSDLNLFSVPPYEKSQPTLARTGKGAVDDYAGILKDYKEFKYDVLDFDEFMQMCREVGAEPVIVVPADSYLLDFQPGNTFTTRDRLIEHAAAWVRYANIKKKYGIKYWMVGNECWNPNNKNSTAEIYARDIVDFSKAMKAVDSSIAVIPNGNTVDYFRTVIQVAGDYIDYLCMSNYPVWDYRAGYATYRDTLQNFFGAPDNAMAALKKYGTPSQQKKLKLIVAEYGPFDWAFKWPQVNDMGHTLFNFEMGGEQLHRPEIEFSCFWNTRWINNDSIEHEVWDALDKNGGFNAIGYGLMIWGKFLGTKMIHTSSTLHLPTFASYLPEQKKLFVYVLNKTDKEQNMQLSQEGHKIKSVTQAWELFGKNADDTNPVWQKKRVKGKGTKVILRGTSITVIEYKLR